MNVEIREDGTLDRSTIPIWARERLGQFFEPDSPIRAEQRPVTIESDGSETNEVVFLFDNGDTHFMLLDARMYLSKNAPPEQDWQLTASPDNQRDGQSAVSLRVWEGGYREVDFFNETEECEALLAKVRRPRVLLKVIHKPCGTRLFDVVQIKGSERRGLIVSNGQRVVLPLLGSYHGRNYLTSSAAVVCKCGRQTEYPPLDDLYVREGTIHL